MLIYAVYGPGEARVIQAKWSICQIYLANATVNRYSMYAGGVYMVIWPGWQSRFSGFDVTFSLLGRPQTGPGT